MEISVIQHSNTGTGTGQILSNYFFSINVRFREEDHLRDLIINKNVFIPLYSWTHHL